MRELDPVAPFEVYPISIPGIFDQNLGFFDLGEGRWLVMGKPTPKVDGRLVYCITDAAFTPQPAREVDVGLPEAHDPRPFRYPSGDLGIMVAYQSNLRPRSQGRLRRSWGQAHMRFDPDTGLVNGVKTWPGNPRTQGQKNFIPYADTTISHPARGELIGWGDTAPSQFSPTLPLELRGGSLPVDIPDTPYALCAYHVVSIGPSGRKVYTPWLGFITTAWPHGVQAYFPLEHAYLLDIHPEVIAFPGRIVESVIFPMALRRVCGDYEVLCGVQDGATYGFVVESGIISQRLAALRVSSPELA